MLPEVATRVSEHVYAMVGWPNVAIVVGDRGTLVVDAGLGPKTGAVIERVARRLAKGPVLYLTTTHFHPEHAGGEPGFSAGTILIRNTVQQEEMRTDGAALMERFKGFSEEYQQALEGVNLREPDILFEKELKLDLGGVTARLMWITGGHTRGDMMTFVEGDATLISGDIVESKLVPAAGGDTASIKGWLEILDRVEALKPKWVVPDHGDLGDGSLVGKERAFLVDLRDAAVGLKRQGVSVEDAGVRVTEVLKGKYPDWPNLGGVAGVVRRVYSEY